jgi:CHRD domain
VHIMKAREGFGRRSLWMGLTTVALLAACSTAPPNYKTVLSGEKEVPPVKTTASGLSDISVRTGRCPSAGSSSDCMMLVGTVQTTGLAATAGHIHQGAVGQNGPVIVTLVKTGTDVWSVPVGTALTDAQYQAYLAGNLYVNLHTEANKDGEIRAQLRP